ncbi:MAG: hypothetical protein ACYCTH_09610 [Cellulomonas sp.]
MSPIARTRSGLLVALAAGVAGTASGWGLLQWGQRDLIRHIAEVTGLETAPWVEPQDAIAFGARVAGFALLSWLLANRPGVATWRSLLHTGGTFVAWTAVAWSLVPVTFLWWPGPIMPGVIDGHGHVARSAAPAAYLGPLVILIAIAAAVWVGTRSTPREALADEFAGPRPPSRTASRVASGLVGAGVLVGLAGVAALVVAEWHAGTWAWIDLTPLTDRLFVLTTAAAGVAWLVSGTARGTAVLVLVATVAVLGGDLTTESPYQAGAVLLGVATASVASVRRPLAGALDRLTL